MLTTVIACSLWMVVGILIGVSGALIIRRRQAKLKNKIKQESDKMRTTIIERPIHEDWEKWE